MYCIDSGQVYTALIVYVDFMRRIEQKQNGSIPVSYTHLTLPTIYSV